MKKLLFVLVSFSFNALHLIAQPAITGFSPVSGNIGSIVTIKGKGFSFTPSNNIVYFGAVKAAVTAATDTLLRVTVPSGATFQALTVTTGGLTAYSANAFAVTLGGTSGPFTSGSFMPKQDITIGDYPHSAALSDFNGDGKPDLFVSRGSSNTVAVLTNTSSSGTISFATQLNLPAAGFSHEGSAIGDLDGDGKPDIVVTNSFNPHSISVYRNTSSGSTVSFSAKLDYQMDSAAYSVAIGDLDGDGKPDLAVTDNAGNEISVFRNTSTIGNISFATKMNFIIGTNPFALAIGDLDGDGKPEIAVTTQYTTSSLSVIKNTSTPGSISFNSPQIYATFPGPFNVSIGDLDGDGMPDLAASSVGGSIIVVRNTSSSGNLSFGFQQSFAAESYTEGIALGDLDGDGKPDIVGTNWQSDNVSAMRNTSVPGNISFDTKVNYPVGSYPITSVIGDLDGDGRPEIITENSSGDNVSILRNIISANVLPAITSFTPVTGTSGTVVKIVGSNLNGTTSVKFGGVAAASFTVDSATGITATLGAGASGDVSVTNGYGTAMLPGFIYTGPIINSFSPTVGDAGTIVTITGSNFTGATSVKFGGTAAASFTINSSTSITATIGAGSSGPVTVTTPTGTATLAGFSFGRPSVIGFTPASGAIGSTVIITGTNFSITPADNIVFFGAVKAQVTASTTTQLTVTVPAGATYEPISVTVNKLTSYSSVPFIVTFVNDNPAISVNSFSVVGNLGVGAFSVNASMMDLNDDGKPDLVVVGAVGNIASVFQNTSIIGTISFKTRIDFGAGTDPKKAVFADLNGDGKPDMVIINFNSGNASSISVFKNTSSVQNISFANKTDYATGNGSFGIAIADMNKDGKPDVIVTSGNSAVFSILQNNSSADSISFAAKKDYSMLFHPDALAAADLDGDGMSDLIMTNFASGNISIFRNESSGGVLTLGPETKYGVGANPSAVSTADLDGDGKLDVAVGNYASQTISLFKNYSTPGSIVIAPVLDSSLQVTNIAFGDLNGDGKIDMSAGTFLSGNMDLYENNLAGNGIFSFAPKINFTPGNFDAYTAIGDLDGDGKPELAVTNTMLNTVTIYRNRIGDPVITSLSANQGYKGTHITMTGSQFTGATSVSFGGTPAESFNVISSTNIEAIVGAGSSGDVSIITPTGPASFAGFHFIPQISVQGPTSFCSKEFAVLSSTAAANNQWYKNGTAIAGATATNLQVLESGNYTVKVNANGITTTADSGIDINVFAVPMPVISRDGNSLVSSDSIGNQWYYNGDLIIGANGQTYAPPHNGVYTVNSTVSGCSSDFSDPYNFLFQATIMLDSGQYVNIYPNPVKDILKIDWVIDGQPSLTVSVMNSQGKTMETHPSLQTGAVLNLSWLPNGIYYIKIYSNSDFKINKTIKVLKVN